MLVMLMFISGTSSYAFTDSNLRATFDRAAAQKFEARMLKKAKAAVAKKYGPVVANDLTRVIYDVDVYMYATGSTYACQFYQTNPGILKMDESKIVIEACIRER